jgi:hypothetical protein
MDIRQASTYGVEAATVTTLAQIAEINTAGFGRLYFAFTVADAALTAFEVRMRPSADGPQFTLGSVAADYTTPEGLILGASGDLTIAGTSGNHFVFLDVRGVHEIEIWAAGTSSVVAASWGLQV